MNEPNPTPHAPVNQLVTGHFYEKTGYRAWRPQGTDDWLLIYTIGGCGRFGYDGGQITTAPGDMVLLRPRTLHDYGVALPANQPHRPLGRHPSNRWALPKEPGSQPHWELLWTHFHPRAHWHAYLAWPSVAPGLLRLRIDAGPSRRRIAARFADVHRLATGASRRREDFAMNALENLLLLCDDHNPASETFAIDARVREAMDYLCQQLAKKIALRDVADAAGLSLSHLAHLFRRQVGTTPQRFLELQRLNRAKQLLELTAQSIKEISRQLGFESPFYFTLRFKRSTGLSPRAYRQSRLS